MAPSRLSLRYVGATINKYLMAGPARETTMHSPLGRDLSDASDEGEGLAAQLVGPRHVAGLGHELAPL
jgi:hypothetical protein